MVREQKQVTMARGHGRVLHDWAPRSAWTVTEAPAPINGKARQPDACSRLNLALRFLIISRD